MMEVESLSVGDLGANCYIVYCSETKDAAIIDPGGDSLKIMQKVSSLGCHVKCIINTHGHVDHIGANNEIKKSTGASLMIHEDDVCMLTDTVKNLSAFLDGGEVKSVEPDRVLKEGDIIEFGKVKLEVISTPGHTPGGICLKGENCIFTGDTLFFSSIGRSDFPGGHGPTLIASIKEKLMVLPDDTLVYPGHNSRTTIGQEKDINPFIN